MNATSLDQLRTVPGGRDPQDEKMEQIRDLLVGDVIRRTERRLSDIEKRLDDLESSVGSRLSALHARLEALAGEVGAEHRTAFDELSKCVLDLSERIRNISRQ